VEIMASGGNDRYEKMLLAFRDYWERVGVAGEATIIPVQRQLDWEYRMTRGGLLLLGGVSGLKGLEQVHSLQMKTAQNNWVGVNFGNYSNAEMDNLIGLYQSTIAVGERMQVASRIVQQIADQVVLMPLYYYADPTMLANRLVNATARGPSSTQAWNVHEWDVR
jgi:ABC-type transport system substrate-binding protein